MFENVTRSIPGTNHPETQVTLTNGIQSNTAYNISIMTNIYRATNKHQTISSDFSTETTGYTGRLNLILFAFVLSLKTC